MYSSSNLIGYWPQLRLIAVCISIHIFLLETHRNILNFWLQNILDKFNPGARQLINAGKAYLKALHGKHVCLHITRTNECIFCEPKHLQWRRVQLVRRSVGRVTQCSHARGASAITHRAAARERDDDDAAKRAIAINLATRCSFVCVVRCKLVVRSRTQNAPPCKYRWRWPRCYTPYLTYWTLSPEFALDRHCTVMLLQRTHCRRITRVMSPVGNLAWWSADRIYMGRTRAHLYCHALGNSFD